MNNTPVYAINQQPMGAVQLGAVQYGKSSGLHSTYSQLPVYAGSMWDDLTPWDTRAEKKRKEEERRAEEDAAYQAQLEALGEGFVAPKTSPVTLAIVLIGTGAALYFLSRS